MVTVIFIVLFMVVGSAGAQGPDNSEKPGPTTAEAKALIGVDVQRISTEWSAFTRRTFPVSETAVCPVGAICTFHTAQNGVDSGIKVFIGDNVPREEMALTVRFVKYYPATDAVHNACVLMAKEELNGRTDDPSFTVEGGNFTCDNDMVVASPVPVTAVVPVTAAPVELAQAVCPQFGGNDTQMLPDNGCKYKGEVVTAPAPEGWFAIYWDGQKIQTAQSGEEVTTGEATFYPAE